MAFVLYKDSKGNVHKIPAGAPFKKGADWEEVGVEVTYKEKAMEDAIVLIANSIGKSLDETITMLGKALGIPKCARCQLRGQILRRMGELGWMETLRRLKATFKTKSNLDA